MPQSDRFEFPSAYRVLLNAVDRLTIRKAGGRGIPIIPVSSVLHVRRRRSEAMPAAISRLINAASAQNVPCIVLILRRMSVR